MSDFASIKLKGLYTYPNPLGNVPEGSLAVADNIVLDADGSVQSRRGFDTLAESVGSVSSTINKLFTYQGQLIAQYNSGSMAYRVPGVGWTAYAGSYPPVDAANAKTRAIEANSNFYFTTSSGIKKLDTYNGAVVDAGMPPGLDVTCSVVGAGTGFLTNSVNTTAIGTTTSGSTAVSVSTTAGMFPGQYVSGTGISSGTTISAVTSATPIASTTATTTSASTSLTALASTAGIAVGQTITGNNIPANTTVSAIAGTTVTMSNAATGTATTVSVTFTQSATVTLSASATASGTSTLTFYSGGQVSYRMVWGIKDANNNLVLGAPSQRAIITNVSASATDINVAFTIPASITTNHFYQLYRSGIFPVVNSGGALTPPNDELGLVYEGNPTSAQIAAKSVSLVDQTPDSLRGASIYTAESQDGLVQSNYPPPLSKDIAFWKNCAFYANTSNKFNLTLTMLAVGGTQGVASGDTLTIGSVTYQASSTTESANPVSGNPLFKTATSGTPAQNISDTANSLVRVINQAAANADIYAYYVSAVNDLPGKILLQRRSFGGSAFNVTSSAHGSAFNPPLPTSGTTVAATQDINKNSISISKVQMPEAVPVTSVLYVGSAAYEIKRIIPLRDSLFVLKDDGIYRIVGQTPENFYVDLFDDTTKLLATDSAVNLNNTIYCLTNQGVVSISDTGVSVVSRAIEGDLLTLFGANLTSVQNLSFGVSYQSDRKYMLGIISGPGDLTPTQIYVYNLFTNAWTRWPMSKRCGIVNAADNKLYFGDATTNTVSVERKNFDFTDYVEGSTSVNIVSSTGASVVLDTTSGINAGDLLYVGTNLRSVITSIASNTVTVQDILPWSAGPATIYGAISCVVQLQPQTGQNPQALKQYTEIELFFKRARFNAATVSFYSDLSQALSSVTIAGINNGGWGLFLWGSVPWGGNLLAMPIRTYVPRDKQRCSQLNIKLTHRVAYGDFILNGINLKFRALSDRDTK